MGIFVYSESKQDIQVRYDIEERQLTWRITRNGGPLCRLADCIQESVDDFKANNEDNDDLPSNSPQVWKWSSC